MSKIKDWYNACFNSQDDAANSGVGDALQTTTDDEEQKAFLRECLEKLNCEIGVDENDANIWRFYYQGGTFTAYFHGESQWLDLCYTFIDAVPLDDVDRVAAVRRVINDVNLQAYPWTLFYAVNEEQRMMYVHMRNFAIFHRSLPNALSILCAYLDTAFRRQRLYEGLLSAIE